MVNYQELLGELLDKDPFKSTWYYQNSQLGLLEYEILSLLLYDELFDSVDVQRMLQKQSVSYDLGTIEEQMAYMGLETLEDRLIFKDVAEQFYQGFLYAGVSDLACYQVLVNAFKSISLESDREGKVVRFIPEFVYVPKLFLIMLTKGCLSEYNDDWQKKIIHMKPKFAKYFINRYLELLQENMQAKLGQNQQV